MYLLISMRDIFVREPVPINGTNKEAIQIWIATLVKGWFCLYLSHSRQLKLVSSISFSEALRSSLECLRVSQLRIRIGGKRPCLNFERFSRVKFSKLAICVPFSNWIRWFCKWSFVILCQFWLDLSASLWFVLCCEFLCVESVFITKDHSD